MTREGCQRKNRKCKKVFCPSYIDCVDGIILKLRKLKKKTLATIAKEISKYTNWDELFALNHVVKVLTSHGYKFSKAQLYYAIKKLFIEKYHYKFQKQDIIQSVKQ